MTLTEDHLFCYDYYEPFAIANNIVLPSHLFRRFRSKEGAQTLHELGARGTSETV